MEEGGCRTKRISSIELLKCRNASCEAYDATLIELICGMPWSPIGSWSSRASKVIARCGNRLTATKACSVFIVVDQNRIARLASYVIIEPSRYSLSKFGVNCGIIKGR